MSLGQENQMIILKPETIRLYITTITEKSFTIYAFASFTIGFVKRSIAKRLGLCYLQCHLLFNQKVLENCCSLSHYGIGDEANLNLTFNMNSGPDTPQNPQEECIILELQDIIGNKSHMYEIYEPGKEDRTYLVPDGDHFNVYRFKQSGNGLECCVKECLKIPIRNKRKRTESEEKGELKDGEHHTSSTTNQLENKLTKTKVTLLKELMDKSGKQETSKSLLWNIRNLRNLIKRQKSKKKKRTPTYLIYEKMFPIKKSSRSKRRRVLGSILIKKSSSNLKKVQGNPLYYDYLQLSINIPNEPPPPPSTSTTSTSFDRNIIIPCINHDLEHDRMKNEALAIYQLEQNICINGTVSLSNSYNSYARTEPRNRLSSLEELHVNTKDDLENFENEKKRMRQEASFLFQQEENILKERSTHLSLPQVPRLPEVLPSIKPKSKRCAFCNKKLSITNIYPCHCNKEYCLSHRLAEAHNCKFDFRGQGRKLIEKENPLVIAPKIRKI